MEEIFRQLVANSVNKIPEKYRKEIDNVNFFVQNLPSYEQAQKARLEKGHILLGLYEGVPLSKRGVHYHSVLPDKITLFIQPILRIVRNFQELVQQIDDTIWHEIGHYFGLNEREVRAAEARRKSSSLEITN